LVSRSIQQAQTKVEGFHFDQRKSLVEYDDILNKQREIIYKRRNGILALNPAKEAEAIHTKVFNTINQQVDLIVRARASLGFSEAEHNAIIKEFNMIVPLDDATSQKLQEKISSLEEEQIIEELQKVTDKAFDHRKQQLGEVPLADLEKFTLLRTTDDLWIEHLDSVEDLRQGIWLRGSQEMALSQYKKEAYELFEKLINTIDAQVARRLFRTQVVFQTMPSPIDQGVMEQHESAPEIPADPVEVTKLGDNKTNPFAQALAKTSNLPVTKDKGLVKKKIGRNDPCWCGSGKKWKKCHYPELST
jgi:preprotein translocase subunit SecA